ncbi:ligase-associated DNA damage response endonuclease PdeM [Pseudooceanicola sp.]|uniref:ligase-associated DNA damage response endonuclease PdeM n=1 Tax=Pseudooceanicola sp. TaxID=1914328 RepID=UPI00262459AD|nr:ligase-associated DNA damage response endonuclease PdeM [Pseudooceanicola sp.]MDF1856529.1 ligase-associated DNA damage response endonuclease PdeM [Pseudooceanicola sp.]
MKSCELRLSGTRLLAFGSGALFWPGQSLLCVSDLHLGKSERIARRGGAQLPPYEIRDTLTRLEAAIDATRPAQVLCLGDSFDDAAAVAALEPEAVSWLTRLQAGRRWWWIEGNHDPGPIGLGGSHLAELTLGPLTFRHIARSGARAEVSGHYHPKATLAGRGQRQTRPCFLIDSDRLILPAFGTYTGGLRSRDPALSTLMGADALAVLTGPMPRIIPMPRGG